MRKIYFALFAALALTVSCQSLVEEFQPVFTLKYDDPEPYQRASGITPTHTIAQLAAMYEIGKPSRINSDIIISGIVSTSDKTGNFYKSFYIQDETGGIELKLGKNGLYNDYLPGQRIFVNCKDLTIGMYGYKEGYGMGMTQIGFSDPTGEYETSYIENSLLIDQHILRGEVEGEVKPYVLTERELPDAKTASQVTSKYVGSLVTLKGLKYSNEVFCLLYVNPNMDKKSYKNRVFLSDTNGIGTYGKTHGVTTWAMSKAKMTEYMCDGLWDECQVGSGSNMTGQTVASFKGDGTYPEFSKAAYSVSQYFKMGSTEIQIRTSGYSRFADKEIPAEVLSGAKTIDVTGILAFYQGSIQITVNSLSDFVVDGKPLE